MAFPTTGILDNFNRANEVPLSGGGNWSANPLASGGLLLQLLTNAVAGNLNVSSTTGEPWVVANYGPNCEVYADCPSITGTNARSVCLRTNNENTATLNMYRNSFSAGTVLLRKTVAGASTTLQTINSITQVAGSKLGLSAIGSTIQGYYNITAGWVTPSSVTDAAITGAGHVAITATTTSSNEAGIFDNFGGGTIVAFKPDEDFYKPFLPPPIEQIVTVY